MPADAKWLTPPETKPPRDAPDSFDEAKSKEDTSARTADSKTFDNPDGTRSVRIFSSPVHFKDRSGKFVEINNDVIETETGFRNAAGPVEIEIAGSAAAAVLASLSVGELSVSYALEGAASVAGRSKGNKVTYAQVMPGVDLEYEVINGGMKNTLILHQAPEPGKPAVFRFPFQTSGLVPRMENGGVRLYDAAGQIQLVVLAPVMWDSAPRRDTELPARTPAKLDLVTADDGSMVLILEASEPPRV